MKQHWDYWKPTGADLEKNAVQGGPRLAEQSNHTQALSEGETALSFVNL
jgi:hypothetical protein